MKTGFAQVHGGIEIIQAMTYEFNRESVVENLYRFMGVKEVVEAQDKLVKLTKYKNWLLQAIFVS